MISSEFINNIKYVGKLSLVFIIVFLLLKFIINLKPYEAILLSLIIIVSIIIVENLVYINDLASDPLNCDQCKVSTMDVINNNSLSNMVPNPMVETEMKEHFEASNLFTNLANASNAFVSSLVAPTNPTTTNLPQQTVQPVQPVQPNLVQVPATSTSTNVVMAKGISPLKEDGSRVIEYNGKMWECKLLSKGGNPSGYIMRTEDGQDFSCPSLPLDTSRTTAEKFSKIEGFANLETTTMTENQNANLNNYIKTQEEINSSIVNKIDNIAAENASLDDVIPENIKTTTPETNGDKVPSDKEFDQSYVQYQKDGTQAAERVISEKQNEFKMAIGNQGLVKQYLDDGKKYYNRIHNESVSAPTDTDAMRSEMKYGDFNYISPLNEGMTNRMYTYIAPNNWYPINPHPPVCVTNKNCTTAPITISNGNEYMQWASLDDFDNARRFTGNMGINLEYIKNVLNNDNAY
jgi:hypothetical protein